MMVGRLEEEGTGIDNYVHVKVRRGGIPCAIYWISFTPFIWNNMVRGTGSEIFSYSRSDSLTG